MKTKIFIVLILYTVYIIEGCGQSDLKDLNNPKSIVERKDGEQKKENEVTDKQPEEEKTYNIEYKKHSEIINEQNEEEIAIMNPHFPYKEHISLQVHAEYHNGTEFVDETVGAEINRVKICQEGSIYKLTIHIAPFMSSWYFPPDDIMNIYLYVMADKIYRILPYAQLEPNGATVDFYDNDELLVKTLDTDEKLRKNGVIVCQEEEVQEDFFSIIQEGNKVTYYLSETKENGEPGQKDLFVWEKGKGLVEFGTGFGPGPMDVRIDKICENEVAANETIEESDF